MAGITARSQIFPMVYMFLFVVYFLAPLLWLVFSAAKNETDFSNSFASGSATVRNC